MSGCAGAGHHRHHVGLLDPVGGNKQVLFSPIPDTHQLERLTQLVWTRSAPFPAWSTSGFQHRQTNPVDVAVKTRSRLGLGLGGAIGAGSEPGGRPDGGQLARSDDQTYDVNVRLAPDDRNALRRT